MKTIAFPYRTVVFLLFLAFLTASFFILPYGDDWGYKTEPHLYNELTSSLFLPKHGNWRPLDTLWGMLMGRFPQLYPALNHLAVITGHFISAILLFHLGRRFSFSAKASFLSALIFLLSGNTFATSFSIDSLNQSLSLTFGLLSTWNCIRTEKIRYGRYIFWGILSVCAKETGFFFFIIGPSLHFIQHHRTFRALKEIKSGTDVFPLIVGILLTLLYFSFTFGIDFIGNMKNSIHTLPSFLNSSYYNLPFGTAALIGRAFPVDLPALLVKPSSLFIFIFSIAGALPLFGVLIYRTVRLLGKGDLFVWFMITVVLVFAISHASVNAITEMNSYPCIFFTCCLFLPTLETLIPHKKICCILLTCFFLASVTSLIHKYVLILKGNRLAEIVANDINRQTTRIPDQVCILQIDIESLGHDIYQPIPAIAAGSGQIMKSVWNRWDMQTDLVSCQIHTDGSELVQTPKMIKLASDAADSLLNEWTEKKIQEYEAVWCVYPDGKVKVIERKFISDPDSCRMPIEKPR